MIALSDILQYDQTSPLLFTQAQFWLFFFIAFLGFSLVHGFGRLWRNTWLLVASLFFYYKTSGNFVLLLMLVTCSDFILAQLIHWTRHSEQNVGKPAFRILSNLLIALSVCIDLSFLCYYKYAYFAVDVTNTLFGTAYTIADQIILPVGISFFTFQLISYTTDVYRGLVAPVRNLADFGFYVSFFPQLVAGPIVKATDFVPQIYKPYHISRRLFGVAVFWILNGLAKKVILSDFLAVSFIDRVFANPHLFSGFENLAALFTYSLQVYADFSGYTDIAIGLSMLMGFYLPRNFNSPYKAANCSDFWRRWHISLSRWLKTYLYIPLGGNRSCIFVPKNTDPSQQATHKTACGNINSMITMLLGGLWHGASWNFVIWGGLNGIGIVVYKVWHGWDNVKRVVISLSLLLLSASWLLVAHTLGWLTGLSTALVVLVMIYSSAICLGAIVKYMFCNVQGSLPRYSSRAWNILVTFVFITFTRLFFRSSSNLDPASANETAWRLARTMIERIGTRWDASPADVITAYWQVFALFALGMLIHWLPERVKRRYRLVFASMPLPLLVITTVFIVSIIYQFITSDLQPFIYFQF